MASAEHHTINHHIGRMIVSSLECTAARPLRGVVRNLIWLACMRVLADYSRNPEEL
jgi:hypothetical protein